MGEDGHEEVAGILRSQVLGSDFDVEGCNDLVDLDRVTREFFISASVGERGRNSRREGKKLTC